MPPVGSVALMPGELERRTFLGGPHAPFLAERPIDVVADLVAGATGDQARGAEVVQTVVLDGAGGFEGGQNEPIAIDVVAFDGPVGAVLFEIAQDFVVEAAERPVCDAGRDVEGEEPLIVRGIGVDDPRRLVVAEARRYSACRRCRSRNAARRRYIDVTGGLVVKRVQAVGRG